MSRSFSFPLADYLARIGLTELPPPDPAGLDTLVRAQLAGIAFENLDVLAGEAVATDLPAIVDKILRRGRGGYCFELNTLLAEALRLAGFRFDACMARVGYRRPQPGPRTHLVMKVRIADRHWLADAGFGGPAPFGPWPWGHDTDGHETTPRFRLSEIEDGQWRLQCHADEGWERIYDIAPGLATTPDIEMANHFVSTWPSSPFRRIFMVRRHGARQDQWLAGRALLSREHATGIEMQQPIDGSGQLATVLGEVFGLKVPDAVVRRAWATVLAHEGH